MNFFGSIDQWAEKFSDRLNPILVKEVRQGLKGRLFVTVYGLVLLASWLVSVIGVTLAGDAIHVQPMPQFQSSFFIVLQVAALVFVPLLAFRSMQQESDADTWELLCITTLSPRQIVSGKLASAVVQSLLLASLIVPSLAFCSMLPGFDWWATGAALGATLVLSVMATVFSLMVSGLTRNRHLQTVSFVLLFVGLVVGTLAVMRLTYALITGEMPFDFFFGGSGRSPLYRLTYSSGSVLSELWAIVAPWVAIGVPPLMTISYLFLFHRITVSQVTFEADSHSLSIRLTCSLLYVLQWVLIATANPYPTSYAAGYSRGPHWTLYLFVFHWAVFGLSACLEPETISTRIRRRLTFWSRLRSPFLPGGSRALVFMLLHLGATPLVAMLVEFLVPGFRGGQQVCLWSMYLLVYTTFAVAVSRSSLAVKPTMNRTILRAGVVIAVGLSMLPSLVLRATIGSHLGEFFWLMLLNPVGYGEIMDSNWINVTPLMLVALIGVHLNWQIIKRSVLDVSPVDVETLAA